MIFSKKAFSYHVLSSGTPVLCYEMDRESSCVFVAVRAGALTEHEGIYGISHLLEHVVFEGTKNRSAGQINAAIEQKGGEINAATSQEYTLYYVKIQRKHLPTAITILGDVLSNPLLSKKSIEKERAIILSEIAMVLDQPRRYQWVLYEQALFHGTKKAIPSYGVIDDVKKITQEDITSYYQTYYTSQNMVIGLVGKGVASLLPLVEKAFTLRKGPAALVPKKKPKSKHLVVEKRHIQQAYLLYGFSLPGLYHQNTLLYHLLYGIVGRPLSGWIYKELRLKRSLGYDAGAVLSIDPTYGQLCFYASCKQNAIAKVKSIFDAQCKQLQSVSEKEVAIAKTYLEGDAALSFESLKARAEALCLHYLATGSCDALFSFEQDLAVLRAADVRKEAAQLSNPTFVVLTHQDDR
ncbi:MAG: pitrilysin family protein [Candidatus Woesearchaeota archaeon]